MKTVVMETAEETEEMEIGETQTGHKRCRQGGRRRERKDGDWCRR